ncbi:hypothetical protein Lepto1489_08235 [Leptospira interrogans serovar Bataviae]|uniref:Uncharacterized protein n=1 Tax=Leptospira interrogans serovar Bataviae TaxID=312175 RepID=A0AAP9WK06_LEPIR|nr:hypothetical protein Lepto1489_08235 [Leptospira interrogans serovar Bataviae]
MNTRNSWGYVCTHCQYPRRAPAKLFSLFSAGSRASLQSAKHHVKFFVYSNFRILFMVHCSIYASITHAGEFVLFNNDHLY